MDVFYSLVYHTFPRKILMNLTRHGASLHRKKGSTVNEKIVTSCKPLFEIHKRKKHLLSIP